VTVLLAIGLMLIQLSGVVAEMVQPDDVTPMLALLAEEVKLWLVGSSLQTHKTRLPECSRHQVSVAYPILEK
jgi:hypothetical protein